ncbi:MAG: carbohydrate kinase family protein [Chloroflexi bacterium]|nr:carbohydrate kinase family protein [Chloroflexota bacterium]
MNSRVKYRVLSFADLVADVIIQIPRLPVVAADHQVVSQIDLEPGGAGNFLIAGQRLGLSMSSLAVVGSDAFGTKIVSIIRSEGVDVEGIVVQGEDATSTVFVLLDEAKRHVFLGRYGTGDRVIFSENWKQKMTYQADAIQFWGYSLLEERICEALIEAVQFASQNKALISFDPGPLFTGASEVHRRLFLTHSSIVLLTEEEIPSLLGIGATLDDAPRILEWGPSVVCVKRGSLGCVVFRKDERVSHPGFLVEVRDTSAAGDAFNAAFLYGYLYGWPLEQVAAFANAMGAAKVQKQGSGRNVPSRNEVIQILKTNQERIPGLE